MINVFQDMTRTYKLKHNYLYLQKQSCYYTLIPKSVIFMSQFSRNLSIVEQCFTFVSGFPVPHKEARRQEEVIFTTYSEMWNISQSWNIIGLKHDACDVTLLREIVECIYIRICMCVVSNTDNIVCGCKTWSTTSVGCEPIRTFEGDVFFLWGHDDCSWLRLVSG